MAERIEVHEVGLRDGLQNIKTVVPTDLKLAWIKAEAASLLSLPVHWPGMPPVFDRDGAPLPDE